MGVVELLTRRIAEFSVFQGTREVERWYIFVNDLLPDNVYVAKAEIKGDNEHNVEILPTFTGPSAPADAMNKCLSATGWGTLLYTD